MVLEYDETGIKCEMFDFPETKCEAGPSGAVKTEGFLCGFCGEHFVNEAHFTEHIQNHHTPPASSGDNNSTADMLVQEAAEDHLVEHTTIHTGDYDFKCRLTLERHIIAKHKVLENLL